MLRLEDDDSLELRYLLVCAATQSGENALATEEVRYMHYYIRYKTVLPNTRMR